MRTRRVKIALLILGIALLTAGCSAANPNHPLPINPQGGIWDRYFVYPMSWLLQHTANLFGGNYGLAIVIVTILVRLVILPLTIKQTQSQKKMQVLQPEIKKIQAKFKGDPQKAQQEVMKLYQLHNANPLTGCLPVFVQMPILLGFYHAIIRTEQIRHHNFLWLQLGLKDPYFILPILAGLTTYLQQLIMMRYNKSMAENPQMKIMAYVMPVMIFVIAVSLPSALSLYWVFGNIFTMIQYYFLYRNNDSSGPDSKGGLAK